MCPFLQTSSDMLWEWGTFETWERDLLLDFNDTYVCMHACMYVYVMLSTNVC